MKQFAAVLSSAVKYAFPSQEEFADRIGASQSSVSQFLSGDRLPRPALLEQICLQFEPDNRQALTKAYLVDLIPPSAAELVSIGSVQEEGSRTDEYRVGRVPLGSILWDDLQTLGRAAMRKPNLAKMLNYFASLERGEDPHPDYYEPEGPTSLREDPRYIEAMKDVEARKQATPTTKKRPKRGK